MGLDDDVGDAEVGSIGLTFSSTPAIEQESVQGQSFVSAPCEIIPTTSKFREKSTSDDSGLEDVADWSKFKREFTESLQTSEKKMSSEQPPEAVTSPSAIRQQLLIDAITSLHSSRQSHLSHEHNEPPSSRLAVQAENDSTHVHVHVGEELSSAGSEKAKSAHEQQEQMSLSSQKGLLSLKAFETIHESSLDHVLKDIDVSLRGSSDESSLPASDPSPPPPKLAWSTSTCKDKGGEGEALMKELERLSIAQYSKTTSTTSKHRANGPLKGI